MTWLGAMPRMLGTAAALCAAGASPAAAQRATHPAACTTSAGPDTTWTGFSFQGLKLALKLPPQLKQVDFGKLAGVAKRAHAPLSQITPADSSQLVSAWQVPNKSESEIRQVLLYQVRRGFVPTGRPCAMTIAGAPGLVFRMALSSEGQVAAEHWIEAYWPGFVLAVAGKSFGDYDLIIALLGTVVAMP